MRVRAILTDLDGTLLEPDGGVCEEVRSLLADLSRLHAPVCPLTSKTVAELRTLLRKLALRTPASFENGAGVLREDGGVEPCPGAVPLARLVAIADDLRAATGAPIRTLLDLPDLELARLTGLRGEALGAARERRATLPLVVAASWDEAIRRALPRDPAVRVVRGNRFLHLQGDHDKAGAVPRLLATLGKGSGRLVGCGDSPNDAGLLALADLAVIVPSADGPDPELVGLFPAARLAPMPHGRGWAAALRDILAEPDPKPFDDGMRGA